MCTDVIRRRSLPYQAYWARGIGLLEVLAIWANRWIGFAGIVVGPVFGPFGCCCVVAEASRLPLTIPSKLVLKDSLELLGQSPAPKSLAKVLNEIIWVFESY